MDTNQSVSSPETHKYASTLTNQVSTTISTIVVQGGPLQLVIALLKSGESLHIKVAEILPKLTFLGPSLDEALHLQKEHEQLLQQIQNLPSPIEEFYHKVQEKIASNETLSTRLIEDMAHSLNRVWNDIQQLLYERRLIIGLNTDFFAKLGECYGKMSSLETACSDTMIPIEIDTVRDFLDKFKILRTEVLGAVMITLKVGNQLLEKLSDLANQGTLDSRPEQIRVEAQKSITQVETWLEDLHDKRNTLETSWQNRKNQLEQCLALAILARDLNDVENMLLRKRNETKGKFNCGDTTKTAEDLVREYTMIKTNAEGLRNKSLQITKATEELVQTGCFAGDEACARAYEILSKCTEYLDQIDHQESLLQQSVTFFRKAETVLNKLENLETQITNLNLRPGSPNVVPVNLQILQDANNAILEILQLGYVIVNSVGTSKPEVAGVQKVIDEIENRKKYLENICSLNSEQHLKVTEALNRFLEKYNELFSWLEYQKKEKIIDGTINFMGNDSHGAKDCLFLHHQLLSDLEYKGNEINNLLINLTPYLEFLEEYQRLDIEEKIESLRRNWTDLKNFIFKRVDLIKVYIQFHLEADKLADLFNKLESQLKTIKPHDQTQFVEDAWNRIQSQFAKLKNIAKQFSDNASQVADPYLQKDRAAVCIEQTLQDFSSRQLNVTNVWESWSMMREIEILLEEIMIANMETTSNIEAQLYPIFTTDESNPEKLRNFVDQKLNSVLDEIKQAENELAIRIEKIAQMEPKDDTTSDKIVQVKNNLNSIKTKIHSISSDYKDLVELVKSFLDSVNSCRENISQYFDNKPVQVDSSSVDNVVKDYESFKNNTMEHFRRLLSQSENIIEKIKQQEPPGAKEHDTDKIITTLEQLRGFFETQTESESSKLKQQHHVIEFDRDLKELINNVDDFGRKVDEKKSQLTDSSAATKSAESSLDYFEQNSTLLDKRIENFINSSKNISGTYPATKTYIENENEKLKTKRDDVLRKFNEFKRLITAANEYFELAENIEQSYKNCNTFLLTLTNNITTLDTPDDIQQVLHEIEKFTSENEKSQNDKISNLSRLSTQLYGFDKTTTMTVNTNSLFVTLNKLKMELGGKLEELERLTQEQQNEVQKVQDMQAEVKYEPPAFMQPLTDATIQEGNKFIFECIASGYPEPTIEWCKDGISIENNSDYKTKFDGGICTLIIEETLTADSAQFTCKASNSVGVAETSAKLSIQEHETDSSLAPPVFVKTLDNGNAKEGQSFEFKCVVEGNPLPTVQWFKNDVCVDNSSDYNITFNNGEATFGLEEVFLEDQATYTCKASNVAGAQECAASLKVEPLEPTEIPLFTTPLSNVMARVGQKLKLECEVTGIPRPDIIWQHNGKLFTNRDVKITYENEKSTLVITEAFPKDAGTYKVTAKNLAGETTSTCNVSVKGRLPNETSDSELASDMEPIKPSVQLPLKDVAIFEGKSVRLDCVIVGQPEPEVIWYHDNRPVKESADFQLLFQGDRCSLVILEAFLEDAGDYKVVAINSAGEASSSCKLSVTPLNLAEPATRVPVDRMLPTEVPPRFEKLLSDILADEGSKVEFECSLVGDPRPTIKWFLNNKEVQESDRIRSIYQDDGAVKLIIAMINPDDKGVYTIKATNPSGEAKCFSHLIVKSVNGAEPLSPQVELEEKFTCPTFKELFADRFVMPDEITKFECIVVGKPTPKVKWFFNDEPVHGTGFLISTSGDRQVLTVQKVSAETVGKVTCIAENEVGKAACTAHIKLVDDAAKTTSQVMTQEDTSGSSFVTLRKQVTTSTTSQQLNTNINGVPQTQIITTSNNADSSFKQIGDQSPEVFETKQYQEYKQMGDLPPVLQQKSIVSFTKNNATDIHDSIIPHSGQITTGKPVRRNIAPRFVTPLVGKIVDQGVDVLLEGIIDGYPAPEVKITKNDEEIVNVEGKIKTQYQLNKIVIEIKNADVHDAGRYSITATNLAGTSKSTADLVVKKSIFPPVFGRRLQAQVVKKGERVIMDVEVTGMPDPKVTWFKDRKPLEQNAISEHSLKQVGNCYKLILENACIQDSGKYMVRAVNQGGEAESIADFAVIEAHPDRMIEVNKTVVFDGIPMIKPDFVKEMELSDKQVPNSSYSSHQESTAHTKIHGSSESTIITETKRTTEATMRMEHKVSFPDIPMTMSQRTQTPTVGLMSAGTMVDSTDVQTAATNTDYVDTKIGVTQTPPQPPPKPENENIESSSIPKKQAFEYFETKMNQPIEPEFKPFKPAEEIPAMAKQKAFEYFEQKILSPPSTEQKTFKFEEMSTTSKQSAFEYFEKKGSDFAPDSMNTPSQIRLQEEIPQFTKKNAFEFFEHKKGVVDDANSYVKFNELIKTKEPIDMFQPIFQPINHQPFSSRLAEDLIDLRLTPGPPPEMGFAGPMERAMPAERLSEKVKKMEEYNKQTSFDAPPFGGVKLFPQTKQTEYSSTTSTTGSSSFQQFSETKRNEFSSHSYGAPLFGDTLGARPDVGRCVSPKPSAEAVAMEKLWSPRQDFFQAFSQTSEMQTEVPPLYQPMEQQPAQKQSIKETTKLFEEKIKEVEKSILPPTFHTLDLKAPGMVKQYLNQSFVPERPVSVQGLPVQPGSPPEMCFAPQPSQRENSQVVALEKTLAQNMVKEPSRVLPGAVRTIPVLPAKQTNYVAPPSLDRSVKVEYQIPVPSETARPTTPGFKHVQSPNLAAMQASTKQFVPQSGYLADTDEPSRNVYHQKTEHFEEKISKSSQFSNVQYSSKPVFGSNQTAFTPIQQHQQLPQTTILPAVQPTKPLTQFTDKQDSSGMTKEFQSGTYMKNISMSTKQYKTVEEPILQYIPFKPDPPQPKPAKVAPPPSPSKFVRKEFAHSDYESSDYDSKLAPTWRPSDSDNEQRGYKPVRPVLTPTGRNSRHSDGPSPAPPSVFDNPPQFTGPPRPKFQPIDKFKTDTYTEKQQVFKPKPVAARPLFQDSRNESKQSTNYSFSHSGPKSTKFYTGVAGQPIHNAIATETSNTMHMKETTEKSNRTVNFTQTRRIISLDDNQIKKNDVSLEPFPYTPEPVLYRPTVRAHPPPTPTRFIPGEYRESDYESEVENARIRPLWTPNPSDSDEPHYRRVRPLLQTRSTSVPRSYERVMTPMEFDNNPVMMPSKIYVEPIAPTQNKTQTLNRYSSTTKKVHDTNVSRDDMSVRSHSVGYNNNNYTPPQNTMQRAAHQVDGMNAQLKTKAHQFMQEVIQDVKKVQKPILKKSVSINDDTNPHAYRDESRVSEYGTKHIDPDTGLIYFKYDFGYEFGIIFPGEGKKLIHGKRSENKSSTTSNNNYANGNSRAGDIIMPVLHEKTNNPTPNRFTPTPYYSDSESEKAKKRYSLPSPVNGDYYFKADRLTPKYDTTDYSLNSQDRSTPTIVNHQEQPAKKAPMFITPLKDIAVVSGQMARFECIVQCDATPQIAWTKNGLVIQPNYKTMLEYRNGVCRLSIPQAYADDAGVYSCSASNHLGGDKTSAELIIPGNKRGVRF